MLELDIPMSNMAQIKVIGVGGGGNIFLSVRQYQRRQDV